jgi:hypothetical protein
MESILSTNDVARSFYDNYHDYPDLLCGSALKSDPGLRSGKANGSVKDRGIRCSVSDFWFADPFCKSVVKDPSIECYPSENW